jgi:hypothetical protein
MAAPSNWAMDIDMLLFELAAEAEAEVEERLRRGR